MLTDATIEVVSAFGRWLTGNFTGNRDYYSQQITHNMPLIHSARTKLKNPSTPNFQTQKNNMRSFLASLVQSVRTIVLVESFKTVYSILRDDVNCVNKKATKFHFTMLKHRNSEVSDRFSASSQIACLVMHFQCESVIVLLGAMSKLLGTMQETYCSAVLLFIGLVLKSIIRWNFAFQRCCKN